MYTSNSQLDINHQEWLKDLQHSKRLLEPIIIIEETNKPSICIKINLSVNMSIDLIYFKKLNKIQLNYRL